MVSASLASPEMRKAWSGWRNSSAAGADAGRGGEAGQGRKAQQTVEPGDQALVCSACLDPLKVIGKAAGDGHGNDLR